MDKHDSMMCYAWSFDGGRLRGAEPPTQAPWFVLPGSERLASRSALSALEHARSTHVLVYRCIGRTSDAGFRCSEATQIDDFDATDTLRYFARSCALTVLARWRPDPIVVEWLRTGDAALRAAAHRSAWIASTELAGNERLAARVAMFSAHYDYVATVCREAASLAVRLLGDDSLPAVSCARMHQEHVLSAALMRAVNPTLYVARAA